VLKIPKSTIGIHNNLMISYTIQTYTTFSACSCNLFHSNSYSKSTSVIKVATVKYMDDLYYLKGNHHMPDTFAGNLQIKIDVMQRRILVSP